MRPKRFMSQNFSLFAVKFKNLGFSAPLINLDGFSIIKFYHRQMVKLLAEADSSKTYLLPVGWFEVNYSAFQSKIVSLSCLPTSQINCCIMLWQRS